MPDSSQLDRTYQFILESFVARGQAPHYAEIARAFRVSPAMGRTLLHELMAAGLPNWLFPGTDLIASFAPFNNLPTQYRVTIDGEHKWFAQGGFEAPAVCWLFPGKAVRIDAPCLDCGEPLSVTVRDGIIEQREPLGIVGYVDVPFREWWSQLPYVGARIHLFRSEDHARSWSEFRPETEGGLLSLDAVMAMMSTSLFRNRMNGHYVSSRAGYVPEFFDQIGRLTRNHPFWAPPGRPRRDQGETKGPPTRQLRTSTTIQTSLRAPRGWSGSAPAGRRRSIEQVTFGPDRFDVVVSSLAIHYVADSRGLVQRIAGWLSPGGILVYSTEHPVYLTRASTLDGLPTDGAALTE